MHGALQLKEMNNWIGSTDKHLLNDAIHMLHKFLWFDTNTTAFCFSQYSLHLLLLKSSMPLCDRKIMRLLSTGFFVTSLGNLSLRRSKRSQPVKLAQKYRLLSSVHTMAENAAKMNGRLFTETIIFYFSNGQVYGVLRRVISFV